MVWSIVHVPSSPPAPIVWVAPLGSAAIVAAGLVDPGAALASPTAAGGAGRRNRYARPAAPPRTASATSTMSPVTRGDRRVRGRGAVIRAPPAGAVSG